MLFSRVSVPELSLLCFSAESINSKKKILFIFENCVRKVLVITRSGASWAEPGRSEPSSTSQEASDSTGRITQTKKFIQSKNRKKVNRKLHW